LVVPLVLLWLGIMGAWLGWALATELVYGRTYAASRHVKLWKPVFAIVIAVAGIVIGMLVYLGSGWLS
jgi:cation transporter-like permease